MKSNLPQKPTFCQVLLSVLGALFGVQSNRGRERDFTYGHPWWVYLAMGIGGVTILVLSLIGLAKLILWMAR